MEDYVVNLDWISKSDGGCASKTHQNKLNAWYFYWIMICVFEIKGSVTFDLFPFLGFHRGI